MKRKIIFIVLILMACLPVCAFAQNNVKEIDIDVVIRDDGSAYVTQVWNGIFTEGTENFIPITTHGIDITDFKVSDVNGEYQLMPSWNVKGKFEDKILKCGINKTNDGIELCFGISKYGENRYIIEYVVHGIIKSYTDYDGTNFMFINPDMSTFPSDGKISITLANGKQLDESNTGIWGFGYKGQIEFQNGRVIAYTESPLKGGSSMIIMIRMNKGLIMPLKAVEQSFDTVKDEAMKGSNYETPDWIGVVILFAIFAIFVLLLLALFFRIKRKIEIRNFYKQAEYFRDIPNNGNISVTCYLSKSFNVSSDESFIIGATLLSMMNSNYIEPVTDEEIGLFGKAKTVISIAFLKPPKDEMEKQLYNILLKAAGDDGVLQEKELAAYAKKNPTLLRGFIDSTQVKGLNDFNAENGFVEIDGKRLKDLTETGKEQLAELMGLKKYLLEFSLIAEREIKEATIWQDYMVYATLLGIADKVLAQFKKVYPNRIAEFETYDKNVFVAQAYYLTMYNSVKSAEQAARSQGYGGSSSFGGGGGFSGGGSGGGSR